MEVKRDPPVSSLRRMYNCSALPLGKQANAGLWVAIPFRFGTPYWTAIGQSRCRSVFGATCPINEVSVGNDDPNQPHTPLLCAPNGWLSIDTPDTRAVCESHLGSNKES
jgi:hypothetical protein